MPSIIYITCVKDQERNIVREWYFYKKEHAEDKANELNNIDYIHALKGHIEILERKIS